MSWNASCKALSDGQATFEIFNFSELQHFCLQGCILWSQKKILQMPEH